MPGEGVSEASASRAGGSMQRRLVPFRIRTWISSNPVALKKAVERVGRMAQKCGCPEERRTDLEIALMEALANAMKHGNAGNGEGKIFLRCYGGPVGMVVAVRDQGQGFDPDSVPDPRSPDRLHLGHGRGLLLMRELTDYVEHRKGGREVVLLRINH
jgi:serine/threonine-protein kinase RsbW